MDWFHLSDQNFSTSSGGMDDMGEEATVILPTLLFVSSA
jgi:hypothetical protein